MRGEDLVTATPRPLALYAALGYPQAKWPAFAHLPLSSGADPSSHPGKRGLKSLQWAIGLGRWRPLATTQYMILKKLG